VDPSVLVVDDEADLVATYERLPRRQGYRVVPAATCREGVMAVTREPFSLVIADLRLSDGDGLDVVRAARTLSVPPPVLVATGHVSRTVRDVALGAGAAAFLAKPFAMDAFRRLVTELLARGNSRRNDRGSDCLTITDNRRGKTFDIPRAPRPRLLCSFEPAAAS
jgi:DNA-binding response OmpR family regulator